MTMQFSIMSHSPMARCTSGLSTQLVSPFLNLRAHRQPPAFSAAHSVAGTSDMHKRCNSIVGVRPKQFATRLCASAASGSSVEQPAQPNFFRAVLPISLALLVCNMDRICMSVAIMPLSKQFGWTESVQGVIQSGFLWGYMATQLLGGAMSDKYGGKLVMAVGIVWFSLSSMLLPAVLNSTLLPSAFVLPAVLLVRASLGLGEGLVLPAMNNLIATSIPPRSKASALGLAFSGFHTGNLLGLVLSPLLLLNYGWPALFNVFGILGLPLLLVWWSLVPDAKRTTPAAQSNAAPKPTGVLHLMTKAATWAIIFVNFVNHWGYFIYLNWMPSYFAKTLGCDLKSSSVLSFLPWLVMAVGSSASGVFADYLISRGMSVTTVRKGLQTVAFAVPTVALLVLSSMPITQTLAVVCMTVALGTTSLGQAGFVANMSDIAPRQAGQMFGLCNTFGCAAGILGVTAVGLIVEKTGTFQSVFQLTAGLYVAGIIVYNLFATGDKVFD